MPTVTDEPVQGDVNPAGTENPPAADDTASGNIGRSLGDVLAGMYPTGDVAKTSPAEEPDETPADAEDAEPGQPSGDPADKAYWDDEQWAQYVSGNLRRISEVPAKGRAAVNERAYQLREEQLKSAHQQELASKDEVARQALIIADQRFQQRMKLAPLFNALQQAQDPASEGYAPDEVIKFRREHPQDWAAYEAFESNGWGGVDQMAPPAAPQAPQDDTAVYRAAAVAQVAKLAPYKEAQDRVIAAAQSIAPDADGLQKVIDLVSDELVAVKLAERASKDEPGQKSLEQRQAAASERKGIPRPDVAANGVQGGENLDGLPYMELIARGIKKSMTT